MSFDRASFIGEFVALAAQANTQENLDKIKTFPPSYPNHWKLDIADWAAEFPVGSIFEIKVVQKN